MNVNERRLKNALLSRTNQTSEAHVVEVDLKKLPLVFSLCPPCLRGKSLIGFTFSLALIFTTSLSAKDNDPLVITTTGIESVVAGVPTDVIVDFEAVGGTPPYDWVTLDRPPPAGTKLERATGILSGTATIPSGDEPYEIYIQVTDSEGNKAAKKLSFKVRASAALDNSKVRPWYFWLMFMLPGIALLWLIIRISTKNPHAASETP